jgi:hypothetical protein
LEARELLIVLLMSAIGRELLIPVVLLIFLLMAAIGRELGCRYASSLISMTRS